MAFISINECEVEMHKTAKAISRDAIRPATWLSRFYCLGKISRISLTLSCWVMPDPRSIQHGTSFYLGHRLKPEVMNTD